MCATCMQGVSNSNVKSIGFQSGLISEVCVFVSYFNARNLGLVVTKLRHH